MLKLLQSAFLALIAHNTNAAPPSQPMEYPLILNKLTAIEQFYHIKAGVYAEDTNTGQIIIYHARDRFPFQSTVKFIGVSALLAKDQNKPLLQKKVWVRPTNLIFWHPISGNYVNQQVSLQTLAEGALSYSDNPAINIIIHQLGGLSAINQFARNLGSTSFNLKHYEADLNSNPDQDADTSTPQEMGLNIKKIVLGNILLESSSMPSGR